MTNQSLFPFVPDEVKVLAQEAQLGNIMQIFSTDLRRLRTSFRVSIFAFGLCGVGFFSTFLSGLLSNTSWPIYLRLLLGIWLLPLPGFIRPLRDGKYLRKIVERSIYLCEHGLITNLLIQRERFLDGISWKQVRAVWPDRGEGCLLSYGEESEQEALLHIQKALRNYSFLASTIQTHITQVKLPAFVDGFERGEEYSFVRLRSWSDTRAIVAQGFRVSHQGLMYKHRFLPWEAVASIEVKKEKLVIMYQNNGALSRWVSVPARLIANMHIFVGLVSHILKQKNEK